MARILKSKAGSKKAARRSRSHETRRADVDVTTVADDLSDPTAYPDARTIVHNSARAAVATDPENRVLHWNQAATELLGHTQEETIGRNFQEVTRAHDVFGNRLCAKHCAFHQMVRLGEAPESFLLDLFDANDAKSRVAVSIVVVLAQKSPSFNLVYLMTPLHRRRRADEAIDRILSDGGSDDEIGPPASQAFRRGGQFPLTRRQMDVLRLLSLGQSSREIAMELGISVHTVRSHIQRVFRTLDVKNRIEAVTTAQRHRLL